MEKMLNVRFGILNLSIDTLICDPQTSKKC